MTRIRILGIVLLGAIAGIAGSEMAEDYAGTDSFSLATAANARVGRPLTPVSVAGVARRTTRRCAAGVYNC
ncbi:MAG TPA: hypothetical protein VIT45_04270 [Allosphingosinicella sp.]